MRSVIPHPLHLHFSSWQLQQGLIGMEIEVIKHDRNSQAWLFRPFITVYCPSTNYRQSTAPQPPTNLLPHDLTEPHAAAERQLRVDKDNL